MANKSKKKSVKAAVKKKTAPKKAASKKSAPKSKAVKLKKKAKPAPKKPVAKKPAAKKPVAKASKKPLAKVTKKKIAPTPKAVSKPVAKTVKAAPAPIVVKGKAAAAQKNGRPLVSYPVRPPTPPPKPIRGISLDDLPAIPEGKRPPLPAVFLKKQKQRLLDLRTHLLEAIEGVSNESIRTRPEGSDASVGGMHMGDAGSDAYDRDFALSLLSKEQDALNEIQDALRRIDQRSYGYCEMTGKRIHEERLEALPFTRFTREAQEQIERNQFAGGPRRVAPRSVFKLDDESDSEDDEEGEEEAPAPVANESAEFAGQ